MIQGIIIGAASVIVIGGMVPYILDTLKGKTRPNVVSWFTWTLLTSIGATAAWSEGAYVTAIYSAASAVSTLTVVLLGLRHGIKHYTIFDITCQVVAIVGIILWRLTNNADIALAIAIGVDVVAALPTIRHAWRAPNAETWQAFAAGFAGAVLTLCVVSNISFADIAYPIWLAVSNGGVAAIILLRRKSKKRQ